MLELLKVMRISLLSVCLTLHYRSLCHISNFKKQTQIWIRKKRITFIIWIAHLIRVNEIYLIVIILPKKCISVLREVNLEMAGRPSHKKTSINTVSAAYLIRIDSQFLASLVARRVFSKSSKELWQMKTLKYTLIILQ